MTEVYNLERFVNAQQNTYNRALSEIRSGRKRTHWMWYIFPQIKGLGRSDMAVYYSISSLGEAQEYLKHPVLGPHIIEISEALLELDSDNATSVMGRPDDMKLKSSMTLFAECDPTNPVFQKVLEKYFDGKKDMMTISLL